MKRKDPPPGFHVASWLLDKKKRHVLYVGIDPGAHGAIAFLYGPYYAVVDIPTFKVEVKRGGKKVNRTDFDLEKIVQIFYGHQGFHGSTVAAVEEAIPQTSGGRSAYSAYRVGMGYFMWPLFLLSKGYEVASFHPSTWKTYYNIRTKGKVVAMRLARKKYPEAELHLAKHEGRCEALLIARYLKRVTEG